MKTWNWRSSSVNTLPPLECWAVYTKHFSCISPNLFSFIISCFGYPFIYLLIPSFFLTCPPGPTQHFNAYLFITALLIKDLPQQVQHKWNTANIQTSLGCICIKPEISWGVFNQVIGDTLVNLGNDIHFMWGSYKEQCTLDPFKMTIFYRCRQQQEQYWIIKHTAQKN